MRRVVQPSRIIFVDRQLDWSLLLFGTSVVALVFVALLDRESEPGLAFAALAGSLALFGWAFWLLFRKRAFIIDQNAHSLSIVERSLMGGQVESFPLDAVSVRMERKFLRPYRSRSGPAEVRLIVGAIWISIHGVKEVPFLDDLRGPDEATVLAERLAADLGRPLHAVDRDDW